MRSETRWCKRRVDNEATLVRMMEMSSGAVARLIEGNRESTVFGVVSRRPDEGVAGKTQLGVVPGGKGKLGRIHFCAVHGPFLFEDRVQDCSVQRDTQRKKTGLIQAERDVWSRFVSVADQITSLTLNGRVRSIWAEQDAML